MPQQQRLMESIEVGSGAGAVEEERRRPMELSTARGGWIRVGVALWWWRRSDSGRCSRWEPGTVLRTSAVPVDRGRGGNSSSNQPQRGDVKEQTWKGVSTHLRSREMFSPAGSGSMSDSRSNQPQGDAATEYDSVKIFTHPFDRGRRSVRSAGRGPRGTILGVTRPFDRV